MTTTFAEFSEQAANYSVVCVSRQLLADLTTPIGIFNRIVGDQRGFLLESVEKDATRNRYSFIGRNPVATLIANAGHVEVEGELPLDGLPTDQGIFEALKFVSSRFTSAPSPHLPPLTSGLIGYMSYDAVAEIEPVDIPGSEHGMPTAIFSLVSEVVAFDHWSQRVVLSAMAFIPEHAQDADLEELYQDAVARLDGLAAAGAMPMDEPLVTPPEPASAEQIQFVDPAQVRPSDSEFESWVDRAKEYIAAGDIFQVVLSKRFDVECDADPIDVYRVLRQTNPSPYMYYLQNPELSLVGCSPEALVKVQDRVVSSVPIAGTRPRGKTDQLDRALGEELLNDPKEVAEHVMLVDLARNDIGRVVKSGTLSVDRMMQLDRYSHVMHLTSEVSGELEEGLSAVDVLAATMPAGTVSGAPKVRAMEIISEIEQSARGAYAGIVGYFDFNGNADTAITIRTMYWTAAGCYVQAGAGIVADSIAENENEECLNKARVLLAAVKPAERLKAQRTGS